MSEPTKFGSLRDARFWRLCRKCVSQTPQDWVFLLRALVSLCRARLLLLTSSDQALISSLQRADPNLRSQELDHADHAWIRQIGKSLQNAAAVVPWRSDCLVQAIAADQMLRYRGLLPSFFIGVQFGPKTEFSAHCWLNCDGEPVVGHTLENFSVLVAPSPVHSAKSTRLSSQS